MGTDSPPTRQEHIYYTKNRYTWKEAVLPTGVKGVRAIRLIGAKLYGAIDGPDLIVSTDQGVTWAFAGLGIANAYDVYRDASNIIRGLTASVVFNAPPVIAQLNASVFLRTYGDHTRNAQLSTDGGASWRDLPISNSQFGCYADTVARVLLLHDDTSIYRSVDYGYSWDAVSDSKAGSGFMEGSAGVIYANTYDGVGRSTDHGKTWTTIFIAPDGKTDGMTAMANNHAHFSVFGPMGNGIVLPVDNKLYMTTTGGDGALHSPIDGDYRWQSPSITFTVGDPVFAEDSLLEFTTCGGTRIPIPHSSAVDSMTTTVRILGDSLHEFTLEGPSLHRMDAYSFDTAWLSYSPTALPTLSRVRLGFQNSWRGSTWDQERTVFVNTPPADSLQIPYEFSGSTDLVRDTGIVFSDPCQAIVLTGILSQSGRFHVSTLPDTVGGAYSHRIVFVFVPRDTNFTSIDTIWLSGHYLGTTIPFDTTFTVKLDAEQPKGVELISNELSGLRSYPNPITSATHYHTTIPFHASTPGVYKIVMLDEKGSIVFVDRFVVSTVGTYPYDLNGGSCVSGRYRYVIGSETHPTLQTGALVIVR
jgi:hypothetical protein